MDTVYVMYMLELENTSGIFMELEFKGFTTDKAVAQAWADQPVDRSWRANNVQYTYAEIKRIN